MTQVIEACSILRGKKWRPPPNLIDYVLNFQQLTDLGRLSWAVEFCETLADPHYLIPSPPHAWVKLRSQLKSEQELFFLQSFAALREELACTHDQNRTRIITDTDLIHLCRQMATFAQNHAPATPENITPESNPTQDDIKTPASEDFPPLDGVPTRFHKDFKSVQQKTYHRFYTINSFKKLRKLLQHGLSLSLSKEQQKQLNDSKARMSAEANRLAIPAHYLAPTPMLENYIHTPSPTHPLISGWRAAIIKPILDDLFTSNDPPLS